MDRGVPAWLWAVVLLTVTLGYVALSLTAATRCRAAGHGVWHCYQQLWPY